eukprot:g59310.t1
MAIKCPSCGAEDQQSVYLSMGEYEWWDGRTRQQCTKCQRIYITGGDPVPASKGSVKNVVLPVDTSAFPSPSPFDA